MLAVIVRWVLWVASALVAYAQHEGYDVPVVDATSFTFLVIAMGMLTKSVLPANWRDQLASLKKKPAEK